VPRLNQPGIFKSAWFAKTTRKARITDAELGKAIGEVMKGQADDLGGGVFNKRLNENMHRSSILARGGQHWINEYLFAKKDRASIEDDELDGFRTLAKAYAGLTVPQLSALLENKDLTEICHDNESQVQERRLRGDPRFCIGPSQGWCDRQGNHARF
jgi:hypothetical protein